MTPVTLAFVAAILAVVWAALLRTAYAGRKNGWSRGTSLATITACYLALAASALLWLGPGLNGWLGAAGMLAPYVVAVALAVYVRPITAEPRE